MTDKLKELYEAGVIFSIDIMLGGMVMAYVKNKQGYPRSFDTFEEAVQFLVEESKQ